MPTPMMTCKEFKELHDLIDTIYDEADALGYSWEDLAKRARLCYATVRALARYDTMYPRANTVFLLARAVGLKVKLVRARHRSPRVAIA